MYDGVTETPHFKFGVVTDEGLTVYAEVFGYLSDYGLFISDSSHDAAKESSYYYLVEAGVLTNEEYNELLEKEYRQEGVEVIDGTQPTEAISALSVSDVSTFAVTNTAASTTVSGNLGWVDDDNVRHPMQYNCEEVWDSRYGERLGIVYTDVSGDYTLGSV